jgi:hypothetical protein
MLLRVLAAVCLCAVPFWAAADPIPDATYSVILNGNTVGSAPGSYGSPDLVGDVLNLPNPSVHAHVTGAGSSFEQLNYFFRIEGPADGMHVPIVINGSLHLSAAGGVFAQNKIWGTTAQLIAQSYTAQLFDPNLDQLDYQFQTVDCSASSEGPIPQPPPIGSCSSVLQDATVVLHLDTLTGADNRVVLNAAANNQENFVANFDTSVDPIISFAPGFDPTGYRILLSDGIGNTLPEPGAGLLAALTALLLLRRAVR